MSSNKEVFQRKSLETQQKKGVLSRIGGGYEKLNKVTFAGGALLFGGGILVGSVVATTIGGGIMVVDGAQLYGINKYKRWRNERKLKSEHRRVQLQTDQRRLSLQPA